MGSRVFTLAVLLLLILSFSVAIPLDQMTREQRIEFGLSAPGVVDAPAGPMSAPMSAKSVEEEFVAFLVEANSKESIAGLTSGNISQLMGVGLYNVILPKSEAQAFLLDNSVTHFEMIREKPLLNYSNDTTLASTFYNNDKNGSTINVCIVDTGVKSEHTAFTGKTIEDLNCVYGGVNYGNDDVHGHGTHVAGIVSSLDATYPGISKGSINIINNKSSENVTNTLACAYTNIQACFNDANVTDTAEVANNSWGSQNTNCGGTAIPDGQSSSTRFIDAVVTYWDKVIVFSAGNDGPYACADYNTLGRPADAYNVTTVASMDTQGTASRSDDTVSVFSSRGPSYDNRKKPDITAPGSTAYLGVGGILSADYSNLSGFTRKSGTSMSAPHVSGGAALVLDAYDLNYMGVKALLINSAEDINESGWDRWTGWGYMDLNRAYYDGNYVFQNYIPKNTTHSYFVELETGEKGTIVWDRYCDGSSVCSNLTNLDVYLYDETSTLIASSESYIDNVEQVVATQSGTHEFYVVSQTATYDNGFTNETYVIASSSDFLPRNVKPLDINTNSTLLAGSEIIFDVNIQNFSIVAQDINLILLDDSENVLDSNNVSVTPVVNGIYRIGTTFSSGGQKTVKVMLSGMGTDSNSEDNNILATINLAEGDVNITNAVLNNSTIYTSQSTQTIQVDVNVLNINGASKDINVWLMVNEVFQDSNTVTVGVGNEGNVKIDYTVPADTTIDQNIRLTTPARIQETNTTDNNFELTLTVHTIDSNVTSVTPSIASGGTTKSYPITFDVNVDNLSYTGQDVNLLFYINGALEESSNQTIGLGATGEYSFTATMPLLSNDLNFVAIYGIYEYIVNDNNNYLQYNVNADTNDANVALASASGTQYNNRHVVNQTFSVDANIGNIGTGNYSSDLNALLFINDVFIDSNAITNNIGDYNSITFSNVQSATGGSNTIKVSIEPLTGESSLTDNNYSFALQIDANALNILSVEHPTTATTDQNKQIDINVQNLGQASTATVKLYDQDGNVLDQGTVTQAQNDTNIITLYTQALSTNGIRSFTVAIVPLGGEYETDNNSDLNITVSAPSVPVVSSSGGGGGSGGAIIGAEIKTDTIDTENEKVLEYETPETSEELLEVISESDFGAVATNFEKVVMSREMVNEIVWGPQSQRSRRTRITIRINAVPGENIDAIEVIEIIPKNVASDANKITSDQPFEVLKFDPILKFTIPVGTDINYYVDGKVDTNKIYDYNSPAVVGITFAEEEPGIPVPGDVNGEDLIPYDDNAFEDQNVSGDTDPAVDNSALILIIVIIVLALVFAGIFFVGYKKGMLTHKQAKKEYEERVLPKVNVLIEKSRYVIKFGGEEKKR